MAAPEEAEKPYRENSKAEDDKSDPEVEWFRNVYRGDVRQFTLRSFIVGSVIGAIMCLSNLYVGLKTGWGLGVAITACILSFAIYSTLARILPRLFGSNMTILENNAMQSTASSAANTTTTILASAISALLLVRGHHLPKLVLMAWLFFLAVLGTIMAIPMKRQMINIEKLRFPSGTAAAETLKSLYGAGSDAIKKARSLFWTMGIGAIIAWLRDAHAAAGHPILGALTKLAGPADKPLIPGVFNVPGKIHGLGLKQWTIGFEGSLIMVGAGMLMGLRTTISMLVAALVNYGVIAPIALDHGAIKTHAGPDGLPALGYRAVVSFSLWPGAAIMVTSGLLTFALQWRTVLRAFAGFGKLLRKGTEHHDASSADPLEKTRGELEKIEVPSSWFAGGTVAATVGIVIIGWVAFEIRPWLGVIAVLLAFMLSIVACRATGETDITPIGAMGKITQLTYGILAPSNITTNLMTASVTASTAGASADLLNDLKSGYLLGANPRQQFLAQLSGTLIGTAVSVPAFYILVPTPESLGTDRFPAPSAQVWKGVAEVLANGVESLHPWARWGLVIGGLIGIILPLLELWLPKYKQWMPSATGLGLALVIPCFNSVSMFIGALIAYIWSKYRAEHAEQYVTPVASGIIAGESLLGVVVALLSAAGYLE